MSEDRFDLVNRLRTMGSSGWNPIGNEAADRIAALEAKVRELEANAKTLATANYENQLELQEQLAAYRQQVERLVEALKDLRSVVRHFWNDDHPEIFALDTACEKADEALAAVEKERHNV